MKSLGKLFPKNRLYIALFVCVVIFVLGFPYPFFMALGKIIFLAIIGTCITDYLILFKPKNPLECLREVPSKLSNGDENEIFLHFKNRYKIKIALRIIEELPFQFQLRDFDFSFSLSAEEEESINYSLRPTERGEYHFGNTNVFCSSPIGFLSRKIVAKNEKEVPVYPSFLQTRKYELLAISDRLEELGIKKIRKIGQNSEFEKIREYVIGDDYKTINWKATARRGGFMVNEFQDEKSQQVYCVIDKGRTMKMPFNGLSLLDYAINSSLVISNIALRKQDKPGLITFSDKIGIILKGSNKPIQLQKILKSLYDQKTRFLESDFGRLHRNIKTNLHRRSLVLLYTNFESLVSLNRQIDYLRSISKDHLLVVIFFQNTELTTLMEDEADTLREVYEKTIAEKFVYEKKLIVKELKKHGIHAILTAPEHLSVAVINKYLELKSRRMI